MSQARKSPRSTGPGRPKDLEKRAAILDAAKRLFLERSYEGTSMDAIASHAGVSKLTVYSHFTDKETLFAAAIQSKCQEQLPTSVFDERIGRGEIRERLLAIAHRFHALVSSAEAIELFRVMTAQAQTNPAMAQRFYEAGPRRTLDEFERMLRAAEQTGELDLPDPARAAGHFLCLIKGEVHQRRLIGCCAEVSDAECEAHLRSVVDLFMRAYAPRD